MPRIKLISRIYKLRWTSNNQQAWINHNIPLKCDLSMDRQIQDKVQPIHSTKITRDSNNEIHSTSLVQMNKLQLKPRRKEFSKLIWNNKWTKMSERSKKIKLKRNRRKLKKKLLRLFHFDSIKLCYFLIKHLFKVHSPLMTLMNLVEYFHLSKSLFGFQVRIFFQYLLTTSF